MLVGSLTAIPVLYDACRERVQQLVQQRLAEQFRLMGDSLGLPAAGGITLEAAAAAHDVSSGMLGADMSDDEDVDDDLSHLTPASGTPLLSSFCPCFIVMTSHRMERVCLTQGSGCM